MSDHSAFGPAATALADDVETLDTKYRGLADLLQNLDSKYDTLEYDLSAAKWAILGLQEGLVTLNNNFNDFRKAVYDTGLISFDDNNESDLPPYRVGVILQLLDKVFSPYTETFFFQRPAPYETPQFTGGHGIGYTGTITAPQHLFDEEYDGSFEYDFQQVRTQRWDFNAPAYIELSYQRVPTTDPDAPLEVEYRFDNGPYKNVRSYSGSHGYIRGYGTFLELRGPLNPGPSDPILRLIRSSVVGSAVVASILVIYGSASGAFLPPEYDDPEDPEDPEDPGEGDEEGDEEEDPEPMAKRIRLADAAIKLEFYDKEE